MSFGMRKMSRGFTPLALGVLLLGSLGGVLSGCGGGGDGGGPAPNPVGTATPVPSPTFVPAPTAAPQTVDQANGEYEQEVDVDTTVEEFDPASLDSAALVPSAVVNGVDERGIVRNVDQAINSYIANPRYLVIPNYGTIPADSNNLPDPTFATAETLRFTTGQLNAYKAKLKDPRYNFVRVGDRLVIITFKRRNNSTRYRSIGVERAGLLRFNSVYVATPGRTIVQESQTADRFERLLTNLNPFLGFAHYRFELTFNFGFNTVGTASITNARTRIFDLGPFIKVVRTANTDRPTITSVRDGGSPPVSEQAESTAGFLFDNKGDSTNARQADDSFLKFERNRGRVRDRPVTGIGGGRR